MKSELSIWRLVMKNSYLTKSIIVLILILCGFISCNFDAKEKQNQNEKQKKQETVKCNVEYESTYGECPESIIVETGTVLSDSNLPSLSDDSEIVILNGSKAYSEFNKLMRKGVISSKTNYVQASSTSMMSGKYVQPPEKRKEEWKKIIDKYK